MTQLKAIFARLKNPSVIASIVSQVVTVLLLCNVKVNIPIVDGVVAAACSILVLLGILSNPTTQTKGYGDDVLECSSCNQKCSHILVNGQWICTACGTVHTDSALTDGTQTEE